MWSDGCGGQNKNHQLQRMHLAQAKRFRSIHHKFPEVGHTYLQCDRCFGHIGRKKRKTDYVFTTDDWAKLIVQSRPKKPFQVFRMKQDDFIDVDGSLKEYVCLRKKAEDGQPVRFQKVMAFEHDSEKPFKIALRYSHGNLQHQSTVSYRRRRRRGKLPLCAADFGAVVLRRKYTEGLLLKTSVLKSVTVLTVEQKMTIPCKSRNLKKLKDTC